MELTTLVFLAIVATGTSGCVVENFNSSQAAGEIDSQAEARRVINRGMTMDQVRAKMGHPTATAVQGNRTIWSYVHSQMEHSLFSLELIGRVPDTKTVMVTFNSSGRVSAVDYMARTH